MCTVSGRMTAPKAAVKIKSGLWTLHRRWKPACPIPHRTGEVSTFLLITGHFTCNSDISSPSYSHSDKNQWCNSFVLKAEKWRKTDFVLGRKKQTKHFYFANALFLRLFPSLSLGAAPRGHPPRSLRATLTSHPPPAQALKHWLPN